MATDQRFVRTSETALWQQCRLKWYLAYNLGFISDRINPNFWLGGFVHYALSEWYLGHVNDPAHFFWWLGTNSIEEERADKITIEGMDVDVEGLADLDKMLWLGVGMLEGYVEWAAEWASDFDVIESELSIFLDLKDNDGRPFTYVVKLDLLTENSEGLRVADFKTAADFRDQSTVHTYQQFRRYPWILREAFPEWKDDVVGSEWIALRKIVPSNRSKPPYFMRLPIDISPHEFEGIGRELVAEATAMLRVEEKIADGEPVRDHIYPTPSPDCAWRCDFFVNGMCQVWRSGEDDLTAVAEAHGELGHDHYGEYREEFFVSVDTIGRREGG